MKDITAETVSLTFATGWIARFGVPSTITSDRGHQFESHLWTPLMQLLGCKNLRTTSYHPVANGIIERFHRQLKASLKTHTPTVHWIESLPLVLLGIRTALKNDLHCSTAELVYGTILRLAGEFFQQSTTDMPHDLTTASGIQCATSGPLLYAHSLSKTYMSARISPRAPTSLFVMTPCASPCSNHTMGPTESWPELTSTSRSTSMAGRIRCPLTV